jgi:hypothetical protein
MITKPKLVEYACNIRYKCGHVIFTQTFGYKMTPTQIHSYTIRLCPKCETKEIQK